MCTFPFEGGPARDGKVSIRLWDKQPRQQGSLGQSAIAFRLADYWLEDRVQLD